MKLVTAIIKPFKLCLTQSHSVDFLEEKKFAGRKNGAGGPRLIRHKNGPVGEN